MVSDNGQVKSTKREITHRYRNELRTRQIPEKFLNVRSNGFVNIRSRERSTMVSVPWLMADNFFNGDYKAYLKSKTSYTENTLPEKIRKPAPGYEGLYEVTDQGDVISIGRTIEIYRGPTLLRKFIKGHILKPTLAETSGYLVVGLCKDGERTQFCLHRLVCLAFNGEPPDDKPNACHNDGDRFNNAASNLRWDSHLNNSKDMISHGTRLYGEKNSQAVLREENILQIRERMDKGEEKSEIAKEFGVSPGHIYSIYKRFTWKHL